MYYVSAQQEIGDVDEWGRAVARRSLARARAIYAVCTLAELSKFKQSWADVIGQGEALISTTKYERPQTIREKVKSVLFKHEYNINWKNNISD